MKLQMLFVAAMALATPIHAEEFVVNMLNRGDAGAMVFEPGFVQAQVGDTVRFVPVDAGHNAETIDGFVPEGVEPSIGAIGEELVLELTEEGLYGIRCKPHFGLGMVALIQAGDPVNIDAVADVRIPRKAMERFQPWLDEAAGN